MHYMDSGLIPYQMEWESCHSLCHRIALKQGDTSHQGLAFIFSDIWILINCNIHKWGLSDSQK